MPLAEPLATDGWPAVWPEAAGPEFAGVGRCSVDLDGGADWLAGVHKQDLDTVTDAVLLTDVQLLVGQRAALDAELTRRVAMLDQRRATEAAAVLPTRAWLRHTTRLGVADAGRLVRDARALQELPGLCAAVGAGRATTAHITAVADAVTALRADLDTDAVQVCEQALADAAAACEPRDIHRYATRLRHALAPEPVIRDEDTQRQQRYLRLHRTLGGMLRLDGLLDPESGDLLRTALDALSRPDPAREPTPPSDDPAEADRRTPGQRLADALTDLARLALDTGAVPTGHTVRPHATVVVTWDTLRAHRDDPGQQPAELAWSGPISGEAARRMCCDAGITRLITGPASEPLNVGREARTVTPAIRKALTHRDRHCVFPGCDRPPSWCHAHHIEHWAHGGHTTLTNLALLCSRHHHSVHEGRWTITMKDGKPTVEPPDVPDSRSGGGWP